MHSNQISDNVIEKTEEQKKLRIMLISTIISYPLWGLLSKYMVPDGYDPLWQRLLCSLITLVPLVLTFKDKNIEKRLSLYYLVAWLYSYHLLFLYWNNPDSVYYVICNLIQFPYVVLCFPSKRESQIYTYTKLIVVGILAIFLSYKDINPWFIFLSMVTLGHYVLTIMIKHFNVIDNLKQTKAEFDLALSNMLEGVLILDEKGHIVSYNNSAAEILSLTVNSSYKETSLFQHATNEYSVDFQPGVHPFEKVLIEKKPSKGIILGIQSKGKKVWLLLNIQPLAESDKTLVSFSDITEIRKNQDLKEKAQAHLAMNAKLSSLFKVAGGIAHEINNPLSVITTRLQSIERKLESDSLDKGVVKTSIEKSLSAAFRISQVVGTLLNLSKNADENPMERVRLMDVLEPALKLCRENFRSHDIELVVDDVPEIFIECRPTQISQVFLNLLNNSFEATLNQEIKWARFSFYKSDQKILITVSDSGPRIPQDVQQRMMEPFFTTKDVGKGAGLGLSVSKAILEEHHGSLVLEEDAMNTSFIITLNLSTQELLQRESALN